MSADKRLRWCCRRGMLELDQLLIPFFDRAQGDMDTCQRIAFERLLEYSDQVLFGLLTGQMQTHDSELSQLIFQIRRAALSAS